ncbi:MAG TPA: hypothetical protein VNL14_02570 [Candidatus Acidoferrales bacterium]|nr:hypothetical protein [Candidatus Acidoferrales bacterium]
MEFNVLNAFPKLRDIEPNPDEPYAQGTAYFVAGNLGAQIEPEMSLYAGKARMDRRAFLKTASGFAAAMLAVNKAAGVDLFAVERAEGYDLAAAHEKMAPRKPGKDLVVDVHTHVAWRRAGFVEGKNMTARGKMFIDLMDNLSRSRGLKNGIQDISVENYGRLVYDQSDTAIGLIHPFGFREDYGGIDLNPIEEVAEIRTRWPDRTLLLGGGLTPNQGVSQTLERLDEFVEKYKISGLKLYTADSTPKRGWWLDDEKLAYPIWERCRKHGIKKRSCQEVCKRDQAASLPLTFFTATPSTNFLPL